MEQRLHSLIGKLENEKMMAFTLSLNDDLTKTIQRYEDLKKGFKPEIFRRGGKNPFAADKGKSPIKKKVVKVGKKVDPLVKDFFGKDVKN